MAITFKEPKRITTDEPDLVASLRAEIERLQQRVAQLEADAERWRNHFPEIRQQIFRLIAFMAMQSNDTEADSFELCERLRTESVNGRRRFDESLAAIDAAREGE